MKKFFSVIYKGVEIDVLFQVPPGQERLAQKEWDRLPEYLEKFFQETSLQEDQ